MRLLVAIISAVVVFAAPVSAQERGRSRQGVPPGHLPSPGECRVWYDNVPPGHQPPPTSCREAERIAARDRYARVIYGDYRGRRGSSGDWRPGARQDGRWEDRRDNDRAVPRRDRSRQYPYPTDRRGDPGVYLDVPFTSGYEDGLEKGREDARARRSYDPTRHSRYRSADRGYDRRYGTRDEYRLAYREGFGQGYEASYDERGMSGTTGRRPGSVRRPPRF